VSIGLIGELGVQAIDVAHWYRGRFPARVAGSGSVRFHQDGRTVFDTAHADLFWDDGVRMNFFSTLASSYDARHEVFVGSNSSIKLAWSHAWMFKEADAPTQGWEVYANRQQFHNDEGITLIAGATKLAEQGKLKEGVGLPHPSLYYALSEFFRAVIEGAAPTVTIEDGARATAVAILAHRASLAGEALDLPPDLLG
jgi:predicted dehydrogenase